MSVNSRLIPAPKSGSTRSAVSDDTNNDDDEYGEYGENEEYGVAVV